MYRLISSAAFVLIATSAAAQMGNPGFWAANTQMAKPGQPAPHQVNNTDALFAQLAAAGGLAEVEFGKLAGQKTDGKEVKDFADRMVRDHSAANAKLKDLAEAAKIPLPDAITQDDAGVKNWLGSLKGAPFEIAYIKSQIVDHQKTAQLLEWEIDSGEDAALQRFAAETLPTVLDHLQLAQQIQARLTGAALR
jgi:putative membrane protein